MSTRGGHASSVWRVGSFFSLLSVGSLACSGKVIPSSELGDARVERNADGSPSSDGGGTPDEVGMCFADFPCHTWEKWRCDDDHHARAYETHDCHYSCGPGPCAGGSCDSTGVVTTCPSGTRCVEARPPSADGGALVLDGPCQKIEAADAGACPAGETEIYEGPGCDGKNRHCAFFDSADACAAVAEFCTCDGKTRAGVCGSTAQVFAYVSEGACPGAK